MKVNKTKLKNSLILLLLLVLIIVINFSGRDVYRSNFFVIATFVLNGFLIVINIMADQKPFSLNKAFWYFNFFFFFIAPLFQYISNYTMWNYKISDQLYIKSNIIISASYMLYMFFSSFIFKNKHKVITISKKKNFLASNNILLFLTILSFFSFLFLVINISFNGLFEMQSNNLNIIDSTVSVILRNLLRSIPVYSLTYSIYCHNIAKKGKTFILINLLFVLLINFPTSITRYWVGLVYIGVIIVLLRKRIIGRRFDLFMIIIFLVVFPVFQLFKWYSISEIINSTNISTRLFDVYNSVDFDTYSMLPRTINFVSNNEFQYGHQLLATLLFIVPRSIWSTKPYPTGQFIAITEHQFYTNISCPLYAEGYIDFGLLGTALYVILICYFISKLDSLYWNEKNNNDSIAFIDFYYPFLFGFLIFLLRGSLQPVIVYAFTFFLFSVIIKAICFRRGDKE